MQRQALELCRSRIKEMSLPKKFDHNKRFDPGSFTTRKEWRRGGLVENFLLNYHVIRCVRFVRWAKWPFDRLNYSALDFVFRPCLTISAFAKIRFSLRYRPVTGLAENEYGKRRNEEKEGLNLGWSGETGKLQWWHNELSVSWLDALWCVFCACYRQLSNFTVDFRC